MHTPRSNGHKFHRTLYNVHCTKVMPRTPREIMFGIVIYRLMTRPFLFSSVKTSKPRPYTPLPFKRFTEIWRAAG